MVMDALARLLFQLPYDEDGKLAAQGKQVEKVLAAWMAEPFFSLPPPKATGRELFGQQFVLAPWSHSRMFHPMTGWQPPRCSPP